MPDNPSVTVVIPTYNRPDLLRRAVESVRAQTWTDYELIISDDEGPGGASWDYLQDLAAADPRVRVVKNPGQRGQTGNMNNVLALARGTWIKPLYDDDELCPDCLHEMLDAVSRAEGVALVNCLTAHYSDNRLRKVDPAGARAPVELMPGESALLAMYIQDVGLGIPSQVMVRRDCVQDGGVTFEQPEDIVMAVDSWWYARLLKQGDLIMLNKVLVRSYQGAHETVTSGSSEEDLDHELERLRDLMTPLLDSRTNPPSLRTVKQMLRLIRALHRLSQRQVLEAAALAVTAWHPHSWWLSARWLLRRSFPGRFDIIPRHPIGTDR